MMWLLLFALTLAVVLLPMLPALQEWWHPADVVPLHIDTLDAQDPAYMARSFFQQLVAALSQHRGRLGQSRLLPVPAHGQWLRSDAEQRAGASRHVWHGQGEVRLPPDADMLGEVAATGDLHTAMTRVYRALWSGGRLHLAPQATVLRWAHGREVVVAPGCRLAGRISADASLSVGTGVVFTLLHAPVVHFGGDGSQPAPVADGLHALEGSGPTGGPTSGRLGLPEEVLWNPVAGRGTCAGPLQVGPGRAWRGDLVCQGDLLVGRGCRVRGSIKSWGELRLDVGSRVLGNLVATGRIVLGADCVVQGAVVSERAVLLGPGCVVGAPGAPATVSAPRIVVSAGATVHGTLWAGEEGSTPEAAGFAQAQADDDGEPWPQQAWA